jgi:hypothetical protein
MRLQIITFIFLAICLALLALYALHQQVQTNPTPPPGTSDTPSSQYRL